MYKKTSALINQQLAAGIFPGVCYTFFEDKMKAVNTAGYAQLIPEKIKLQSDFLFDVASLTKVVCTTTVMLRLYQAGKLNWDQPLATLLPEFQNQQITLRHLLTHTSDIQTYIPNRDALSADELRAAYLTLQPGPQLGHAVKYTDAGTILLGFLLEELYQQPVIEIFKEEVLQPLGMSESLFLPTEDEKTKIVPTEQLADGTILKGVTHDPKARTLGEHAGNAGLFTTSADLEKLVALYLTKGKLPDGTIYLEPAVIDSLLLDQTPTKAGDRSLGWDLKHSQKDNHSLLFHTGYTGTFLLIDVISPGAFIFLSNRVHPIDDNPTYLAVRDQILEQYLIERKEVYQK